MTARAKRRQGPVYLISRQMAMYTVSYVGPTYPTLPPWPTPIGGDWWAVDSHSKYAHYLKHNGELDMAFTEEQIRARFDAAEAYLQFTFSLRYYGRWLAYDNSES